MFTQQVDQVEKVACRYRWSVIEKNGFEARKSLLLTRDLMWLSNVN